jgi:hypothetical protein
VPALPGQDGRERQPVQPRVARSAIQPRGTLIKVETTLVALQILMLRYNLNPGRQPVAPADCGPDFMALRK